MGWYPVMERRRKEEEMMRSVNRGQSDWPPDLESSRHFVARRPP